MFAPHSASSHSSLSTLGGDVTQITTNKLIRERKHAQVSISPPEIGELELGFSSVLGSFDAIVDTLEDEAKSADAMCMGLDENVILINTKIILFTKLCHPLHYPTHERS